MGWAWTWDPSTDKITSAHYAFEVKALRNHGFAVDQEQCIVRTQEGERHWFDRKGKQFNTNIPGLKPSLEPTALGLPVIAGSVQLAPVLKTLAGMRVYSIEPGKLREMQDPDSGVSLRSDGSNAASVLQEIERQAPEDISRISELLSTIVPNTTRVRPLKHGNKLSLELTQQWGERKMLKFGSSSLSDGTLRALGLLTAVYQRSRPSLLVIEEPEATIHPGALGAILDLLRHASRFFQLVVTTHSPDVLDAEYLQDRHLRIVTWSEGATRIGGLSRSSREALQEHLQSAGDLLRSNALGGEPVTNGLVLRTSLFEDLE